MKRIFFSLLLILVAFGAFAQPQTEKRSFFQLTFVPPLGTHGSQASQYTNSLSLNLLLGISANETGFTLGGLSNIVRNNTRGFQMAGISNIVGGSGSGFLMSGLVNNVRNDYRGFQISGIANITGKDFSGFQFAGLTNIAGNVSGFQFSGLLNIARNVRGTQFGVINIAESNDYPIGLINIVRNGEKSIGVSYNDVGSALLTFRSGGRVLYGILGAGFNHKADDEKFVIEAGFGAHINIVERFRINNELKAYYMSSFNGTHVNQYSFAILPAFKATKNFEIFAGPSINFMESDNIKNGKLFPNHSFWKKYGDNKLKQLFVGYTVGTHFIF